MGNSRRIHHACALAGSFLLSAPASAQQTDCRWIGSTWTCNSQPSGPNIDWSQFNRPQQSPGDAYWAGVRAAQERRAREQQQAFALQQQRQQQQRHDMEVQDWQRRQHEELSAVETKTRVGRLLQAGDCDGAKNAALSSGMIDLANQVNAYCAAQAKQK